MTSLQVSWFPDFLLPAQGRLCLSRIPGGARASRDEDLQLLVDMEVTDIICLLEEHELQWMDEPETMFERQQAVEAHGMSFFTQSIEDLTAPTLQQAEDAVAHLRQSLHKGGTICIHCGAGLGRAGTLAACLLVSGGMKPEDSIKTVRWIRPGAIQSQEQEELIHQFASLYVS